MMIFNKVSVGLELDNFEARVVEITSGSSKPKLLRWGRLALPEGVIKDGIIVDMNRMSAVLEELWDTFGIKSKNVMLGVLNQDVIIRFATFPKIEDDKLKGLIQYQAQELLPVDIEKLIIDYIVVDEFTKDNASMVEVLLVAVRKTMIEGFTETCEKAHIKINDIDVSLLSLGRLLSDDDKKTPIVIANFYNDVGSVIIIKNGVPRFARITPISFINKLGQNCFPKNLFMKESYIPPQFDNDDLQKWGEALAEEINLSIDFYQSQNDSSKVEKILVCGLASRFIGLKDVMTERFDIPFKLLDITHKLDVKVKSNSDFGSFEEPDFAVCVGLALRGLEE
jgi:type IV pilus assembly protein PilM